MSSLAADFFLLQEISRASGRDLTAFREQWLERAGAPTLELADVAREGNSVSFTLRQSEPPYDLLGSEDGFDGLQGLRLVVGQGFHVDGDLAPGLADKAQ